MSEKQTTVSVKILEKEYQVSCPEDEVEALSSSARYLDRQMSQIRDSGKVFGLDTIAVMAALNITHELLSDQGRADAVSGEVQDKLQSITQRITRALAEQKQLNL
jgi:cell division protein ZapA